MFYLKDVVNLKEADFSRIILPAEQIGELPEKLTVDKLSGLCDKNLRAKIGLRLIDSLNKNETSGNEIADIHINDIADIKRILEFDYSCLEKNEIAIIQTKEIAINQKPLYCKNSFYVKSKKTTKSGCADCNAICLYSLKELMDRKKPVDQLSTINELHRHGHPKSMKMPRENNESTMRKTDEARQQLIEHYKYAHHLS
jgi:hypothetical protein